MKSGRTGNAMPIWNGNCNRTFNWKNSGGNTARLPKRSSILPCAPSAVPVRLASKLARSGVGTESRLFSAI
jgi:hypothetical protein